MPSFGRFCPRSGPRAGRTVRFEVHRPIGNGEPERRPDGALDQRDIAAVGADQLARNHEAQARAAAARRALERLEPHEPEA